MGNDRRPKRGRPGGGGHFSSKRRRIGADITKKQKIHLTQYGEAHPVDDTEAVTSQKYKIIHDDDSKRPRVSVSREMAKEESSDDNDDLEDNTYMDLLSSLGVEHSDSDQESSSGASVSEGDSAEDERETEEVENEHGDEVDEVDSDDDGKVENDDDDADTDTDDAEEVDGDEADLENPDVGDESDSTDSELSNNSDEKSNGKYNVLIPCDVEANGKEGCSEKKEDTGDKADDRATEETVLQECDPFRLHFDVVLSDILAASLLEKKFTRSQETVPVPHMSRIDVNWPKDAPKREIQFAEHDVRKCHVKLSLCNNLAAANLKLAHAELTGNDCWTSLQQNIFSCINSYKDLYFPERSYKRGEELRLMYCMHALNHVLKTRGRIMAHNAKIRSRNDDVPDECRDKGFTRPKVLVLLPFRDSALRVINMMSELVADKQSFVSTRNRFVSEYSTREGDEVSNVKHEDNETIFTGNTNECFSIGLGIAKKTLKLFTRFDDSDIIMASPLGLWGITEAKKDGEQAGSECDFLSSIEVMIVDQADVLFMQNWDHMISLLERTNRQPVSPTGIDFARVRMWTLNGWSKLYRQTIFFSEFDILQVQSTFKSMCTNYAGQVLVRPTPSGIWCRIFVRMRHEFCRFSSEDARTVDERRFQFMTSNLLSVFADAALTKTLVFISSSFDFIRLRNHLMRRRIEFVALTEYDEADKIKRARSDFVNEDRVQLMLITERFMFYRRREIQKITGVRHVLFYDLPTRPQLYAEVCNWVRDHRPRHRHHEDSATVRVLYCMYDIQRLRAVLGVDRADVVNTSLKNNVKCVLDPPMLEN